MSRPQLTWLGALAATVLLAPGAHAAGPQVTDPASDANGVNGQQVGAAAALPQNNATPVGSQAYADVLSVEWKTLRTKGKPTGFSVVMTLSAAPTPPAGTSLVYRMLGTGPCGTFFGVVYYTKKSSDPSIPVSAIRDDCNDVTRLTPIATPVVNGGTVTWTVPLTAIPKGLPVKLGTVLKDLRFEVVELEDFQGQKTPDGGLGTGYEGIYGLGLGRLDLGKTTNSYKIGS